jgi:hypothetical protein
MRARAVLCGVIALGALAGPAVAQPRPSDDEPSGALAVPGGDIFGFTSPTDVGSPGDKGLAFETTTRFGKRGGSYIAPTLKNQFSATISENLSLAVSPFITGHRIRAVPGLVAEEAGGTAGSSTSTSTSASTEAAEGEPAVGVRPIRRSQLRFDGFSAEANYRILARTAANPVAATISIEPRWARVDALAGERVDAYATEAKLFVDAVLVPERLYGALNLNYAVATQHSYLPGSRWERSSGTLLSGALAYQATERLFVGVEARYLTAFSGAFLNQFAVQGLFVGPNLLIKLSDSAALNVAWTPQVAGKAKGMGERHLDLDNFERHQFRLKLATSF